MLEVDIRAGGMYTPVIKNLISESVDKVVSTWLAREWYVEPKQRVWMINEHNGWLYINLPERAQVLHVCTCQTKRVHAED